MSKRINRTTVELGLRVRAEVKERVESEAARYGLSVSAYVSDLIVGRESKPKVGVELGPLVLLGQRVVAAISALPNVPANESVRVDMAEMRRSISDALLALRTTYYDAPLDERRTERWSG
ncbi:MAG TPA: hypothetical protein VMW12_05560 [Candidatus Dormibacteraeota bacterium]|nr:hypothetical protein [Candidatus Dormibacteraeota bacterium]